MKEGWLNIPSPNSSEEELIKYANLNYPKDTKYYCPFNGRQAIVRNKLVFYKKRTVGVFIKNGIDLSKSSFITDGSGGTVWVNGIWSKKMI